MCAFDKRRSKDNSRTYREYYWPLELMAAVSPMAVGDECEAKPRQPSNHKSVHDLFWHDGIPGDEDCEDRLGVILPNDGLFLILLEIGNESKRWREGSAGCIKE